MYKENIKDNTDNKKYKEFIVSAYQKAFKRFLICQSVSLFFTNKVPANLH